MKHLKKRILSLSIGAAMLASAAIPAMAASSFTDVGPEFDWAAPAIEKFAEANIIGGIGDNQFAPNSPVTREQLAKILVLGYQLPEQAPSTPTYSDVPSDKWSYVYIESLGDILTGKDGKFEPERNATRAEVASAAVRALGLSGTEPEKDVSFPDISDVPEEFKNDILIAAAAGIIGGYEDGTFHPNASVTRAEAVVILDRAISYTDKADERLVALEVAKFADTVTLPYGTPEGDVTNTIMEQLVTGRNTDVELSLSLKNDESGLFEVTGGTILLKSSGSGTAIFTATLQRGNAKAEKDFTVTVADDGKAETYYVRRALLTGESKTVAFGTDQQKFGVQLVMDGKLTWYYSEPYPSGTPFPIDELFSGPSPITEMPGPGFVSAEIGDKGSVRKIYYTPSDMNAAVENGRDGAMITDLSDLSPNPVGSDYTFYRASYIDSDGTVLTLAPIGKDGRAEVETATPVDGGTHYTYTSDKAHHVLVKLADDATITLVDGKVTGEDITSAREGTVPELIGSIDAHENYCMDFTINDQGEATNVIFYLTPQSNDFTVYD